MNTFVPLGRRVRDAGDQAVPMLVDILIKAAAQAGMALDALSVDITSRDLEEVDRRLTNVLRILLTGEK
jgi:hypothetical protein